MEQGQLNKGRGTRYLHTCRVKIIDSDMFPSNDFEHEIKVRHIDQIPSSLLMSKFMSPRSALGFALATLYYISSATV